MRCGWIHPATVVLLLAGVGQDEAIGQVAQPLRFRRVMVPVEALDSQVRGLLPMRREEFERRLSELQSAVDPLALAPEIRCESATYRATFEDGVLRSGRADLVIAGEAAEPALLPLKPCSLALHRATWAASGDLPERAAVVGVEPEGTLQCLVEQPGTLSLDWQLAGTLADEGHWRFALSLPIASRRVLEIDAPADCELSVDQGIVSESAETTAPSAVTDPRNPPLRRWSILLAGAEAIELDIRRIGLRQEPNAPLVARENSRYALLRSSFDLESRFSLDASQPIRRLSLAVEPPLQVTSVQLGSAEVPWSLRTVADRPPQLDIVLPEPLAGRGRELRIAATASHAPERDWTLPRLLLQHAVIQQAQIRLTAPSWLSLQPRPVGGCRQTGVVATAASGELEEFNFERYAADGQIEVASAAPASRIEERCGVQIEIDSSQVNGVAILELSTAAGEWFSVEAVIPKRWIVDSIETLPAEMLSDRKLAPRGSNEQLLKLSLARPITKERPLRVIVRGHFRRPAAGQSIAAATLRLASLPAARSGRCLVAIGVADPASTLEWSAADLEVVNAAALSAADMRLFESPPGGKVFSFGAEDATRILVSPAAPRYRSEAVVQAHADSSSLRQKCRIVCRPESSLVRSVLVQLSPAPSRVLQWGIVGEDPRELTAELVNGNASPEDPSPTNAAGADSTAFYRLTLQRPRSAPFELWAEWENSRGGTVEASLVGVPEALEQLAMAEVHSLGGTPLSVMPEAMTPLPVDAGGRVNTLRARYRYDLSRRPRLHIGKGSGDQLPEAWIESLSVTSSLGADGKEQHIAALSLVTAGAPSIEMHLPQGARNVRLATGGVAGRNALRRASSGAFIIPLPPSQRTSAVEVSYESTAPFAGWWNPFPRFQPPLPRFDVPVRARTWKVCLAPGLVLLGQPARALSDSSARRWAFLGFAEAPLAPAWNRRLASGAEPARESVQTGFAGWHVIDLDYPAYSASAMDSTLSAYRSATLRAWSWCLAVLAAAAAWRACSRWCMPLAGLIIAMAYLLAPPLSELLLMSGAGLALGGLVALVYPRLDPPANVQRGAVRAAIAAVCGLAWLMAMGARPQPARAQAPDSATRPHELVVIPVDEDNQPTGDYVFLSPALYEALHRESERGPAAFPGWLVESSRFDLPESLDRSSGTATVGDLRIRLELRTFRERERVRLPFARRQLQLLEGQARLDSKPIALDWEAEGQALSFVVEMPGRHVLELAATAPTSPQPDGATRLTLSIPPACRAVASLPGKAEKARVLTAHGSPIEEASASKQFALGLANELRVEWPSPEQANEYAMMLESEQLLLWRLRPGSVTVEGRFQLRPLGGGVRSIELTIDERLRLNPLPADSPIVTIVPIEGAPGRIRVDLKEPATTATELRLSWLWPEASGIGALALPSIQLDSGNVSRRWTGLAVDPELEVDWSPPAGVLDVAAAEFTAAWGAGAIPISRAFEEPPQQPGGKRQVWALSVRPSQTQPTVEQSVSWSVSSNMARGEYTARLRSVPATWFVHRVALPPQVRATRVDLVQGKPEMQQPALIRWSQQTDGELIVTLLTAASSEQRLNVGLEYPVARQRARFPLPSPRLQDVGGAPCMVRIFRQSDANVSVPAAMGWTVVEDPAAGQSDSALGRQVAVLRNDSAIGDTPLVVERRPNKPRVRAQLLVHAAEDDGHWQGTVYAKLSIERGVLDELRFELPSDWSQSLAIEPALPLKWLSAAEASRQILVVTPPAAPNGPYEVSLRGPLVTAGAGVRIPDVRLLGDVEMERFVLLDDRRGDEPIEWDTTGLELADRARSRLPAAWPQSEGELFRVSQAAFRAVGRAPLVRAAQPQVEFADCSLELASDGAFAARSNYLVSYAGRDALDLEMPLGTRLVQVLFDGVPAQVRRVANRVWSVSAPSMSLPVRVQVVYDGYSVQGADRLQHFAIPVWAGQTPKRSVCTITTRGSVELRASPDVRYSTAMEIELARLHAQIAALESIVAAKNGNLPLEAYSVSWQAHERAHRLNLAAAQAALEEASDDSRRIAAADIVSLRSELAALRARAAEARSKAEVGGIATADLAEPPFSRDSARQAAPAGMHRLYLTCEGAGDFMLHVRAPQQSQRGDVPPTLALAVALLAWPLLNGNFWRRWLASHAMLLLAIAGIIWYLAAPLPWLGWLAVLGAGWLALRTPARIAAT